MLLDRWKAYVVTSGRGTAWIAALVIAALGIVGCSQEVVDVNRSPSSIADGVSREDSIAAGALRARTSQSVALNTAHECLMHAALPNQVAGCVFPVPVVNPLDPWLQHNESNRDGAVQTLPITVEFSRGIKAVRLNGEGFLSCSGDPGLVTAYYQGAQVYSATKSMVYPDDCGEDDQTGWVQNVLPPDLTVDRIVIEPPSPWVYTHPNTGAVAFARLVYAITWPNPQGVNVVCTPSNPTRGDRVQCKTSLKEPESFTVLWRYGYGADFVVEDTTTSTHSPGDTNTWEGIAVAPTDVQVFVELTTDGIRYTLNNFAHFDVQPRTWPTWQLTTLLDHTKLVLTNRNMTDYPLPGTNLGFFLPVPPSTTNLGIERPSGGPNDSLGYVRDPVQITDYQVNTHPALYPATTTTPAGARKWYKDQNGRGSIPGANYCSTKAQIATLASGVERHEGVTQAANSHFGIANQQFQLLQPHARIEALYSMDSDAAIRTMVDTTITNFFNQGPYKAASASFDTVDVPQTLNSAGCVFDFNPNDQ